MMWFTYCKSPRRVGGWNNTQEGSLLFGVENPDQDEITKADLERITVDSATGSRPSQVVSGRLTLFIGMPAATPGSARPYHLIRADYSYRCQVRHGRVVKASVTQP